jgi:hypothetical protein
VVAKREAFIDFIQAILRAGSEAHAEEARTTICPKVVKIGVFCAEFAQERHFCKSSVVDDDVVGVPDGEVTPPTVGESDQCVGLQQATMQKYGVFRGGLTRPSSKLLADLFQKTHTGAFDADFQELAEKELKGAAFQFADLVKISQPAGAKGKKKEKDSKSSSDVLVLSSLRAACEKWVSSTLKQPAESTGQSDSSAIGEADRVMAVVAQKRGHSESVVEVDTEARSKTVAKLTEALGKHVQLGHLSAGEYESFEITSVFRSLQDKFKSASAGASGQSAVGDGSKAKGAQKQQREEVTLYIACAELFGPHALQHNRETFRGIVDRCSDEFKEVVKWMMASKSARDAAIVADGRSEPIRRELRALLGASCATELWTIYDMETSLNTDVRNPKRKIAWSSDNMETLFASFPATYRAGLKVVARDLFTKSGESTNWSRTYTGVPFRNLAEIPRMVSKTKQGILGQSAVGDFDRGRVQSEVAERGHPLFWGEWKPVALFSAMMRDTGATRCVDLTPGSGAAAIAAISSGVQYVALCHNKAHELWLQNLLERIFLALVQEKQVVGIEKDLLDNVGKYLQRAVSAAKQMLPKKLAAFEQIEICDDDSGDDEEE